MFNRIPGTKDILPDEAVQWQRLEAIARRIFSAYNYQEIRPPLIEQAALFNRSLGEATEVVQTFDCIVDALVRGEKIELRNFGVFKIKQRKSRTGRNPRTGQVVPVPPRKAVVFKPGLEMKNKLK